MNEHSEWEFAGAVPDGHPFEIGGLDVWRHEWRETAERAHVRDPHHHQDFTFEVFEITTAERAVTFAAGEFSNCIWGFYLRNPRVWSQQGREVSEGEWLMRIEGGLAAHFKESDGTSRPGVHWRVGLKHGQETYTVLVKAILADDATAATREDQQYQMQTTMQYLNDQLQSGWHPDQAKEHTIYISNPTSPTPPRRSSVPKKPWWRLW